MLLPRQLRKCSPLSANLLYFSSILRRFPNLTKPLSASTSPKHQVVHYIRTNSPPCHSRLRRLPLENRKAALAEFEHMMQLGIIRRSEQNAWHPLSILCRNLWETGVHVEISEPYTQ